MKLILSVTAGPHQGRVFTFDGHDTYLVGRVKDAHLQLSFDDPYFSRRHFVLEVNPPRCRLMDLKSRNGTFVNDAKVSVVDIKHGDRIRAGHTVFEVALAEDDPERQVTVDLTTGGQVVERPADGPGLRVVDGGERNVDPGGEGYRHREGFSLGA